MNKKKIIYLLGFVLCFIFNYPVYARGYEDISPIKAIFQLLFYISIFIVFIFFTLYGTRLIAKNFKGINSSKYISLLDAINIPGNSKIIIAQISDNIYILSVSDKSTTVIDKIKAEEFPVIEEGFDKYLDKYMMDTKTGENLKKIFDRFHINKDKEEKDEEKKH